MRPDRYQLDLRPRAERQLAGPPRGLPLGVASAALEFILGPLLSNPRRVLDISRRADAYGTG